MLSFVKVDWLYLIRFRRNGKHFFLTQRAQLCICALYLTQTWPKSFRQKNVNCIARSFYLLIWFCCEYFGQGTEVFLCLSLWRSTTIGGYVTKNGIFILGISACVHCQICWLFSKWGCYTLWYFIVTRPEAYSWPPANSSSINWIIN